MSDTYIHYRSGFCSSTNGNSGPFCWWRNTIDSTKWSISSIENFCKSGLAVCDDFGNLVEVK